MLTCGRSTYFHDHWKASLAGHSDSSTTDKGKLRITYANNYWKNVYSRTPLLRFGTAHIYNSYYEGYVLTSTHALTVPLSQARN